MPVLNVRRHHRPVPTKADDVTVLAQLDEVGQLHGALTDLQCFIHVEGVHCHRKFPPCRRVHRREHGSRKRIPPSTLRAQCHGARLAAMKQPPLTAWHWKRAEYERLIGLGLFHDKPVELIGGQLLVAEPQGSYHSTGIGVADDVLRAVLPPGWIIRSQMPVALDEESEPEPDLAVVQGYRADYRDAHPASARPRHRGRGFEPRVRPRREGQPLRARRHRRLLDRQPGRSRRGGVPGPGARRGRALWLALCDRSRWSGRPTPSRSWRFLPSAVTVGALLP